MPVLGQNRTIITHHLSPLSCSMSLTDATSQVLIPLLEQYLASIPAADGDSPTKRSPRDVTPLPFAFPEQPVREDVK